jgi:hypothetical protein
MPVAGGEDAMMRCFVSFQKIGVFGRARNSDVAWLDGIFGGLLHLTYINQPPVF